MFNSDETPDNLIEQIAVLRKEIEQSRYNKLDPNSGIDRSKKNIAEGAYTSYSQKYLGLTVLEEGETPPTLCLFQLYLNEIKTADKDLHEQEKGLYQYCEAPIILILDAQDTMLYHCDIMLKALYEKETQRIREEKDGKLQKIQLATFDLSLEDGLGDGSSAKQPEDESQALVSFKSELVGLIKETLGKPTHSTVEKEGLINRAMMYDCLITNANQQQDDAPVVDFNLSAIFSSTAVEQEQKAHSVTLNKLAESQQALKEKSRELEVLTKRNQELMSDSEGLTQLINSQTCIITQLNKELATQTQSSLQANALFRFGQKLDEWDEAISSDNPKSIPDFIQRLGNLIKAFEKDQREMVLDEETEKEYQWNEYTIEKYKQLLEICTTLQNTKEEFDKLQSSGRKEEVALGETIRKISLEAIAEREVNKIMNELLNQVELEALAQAHQRELAEQKARFDSAQQAIEDLKQAHQLELANKVAIHESYASRTKLQISDLDISVRALREEVNRLLGELAKKEGLITDLKGDLEAATDLRQITEINSAMALLREQHEALKNEKAEQEQKLDELRARFDSAQQELIQAHQRELVEQRTCFDSAQQELIQAHQRELVEQRASLAIAKQQLEDLKQAYQRELDASAQSHKRELDASAQSHKGELDAKAEELAKYRRILKQAQKELEKRSQQITTHEATIQAHTDNKDALALANKEKADLQTALYKKIKEHAALNTRYEAQIAHNAEQKTQLEDQALKNNHLKERLSKYENEILIIQNGIKEKSNEVARLTSECENLSETIEEQETQLASNEVILRNNSQRIQQLRNIIKNLQQPIFQFPHLAIVDSDSTSTPQNEMAQAFEEYKQFVLSQIKKVIDSNDKVQIKQLIEVCQLSRDSRFHEPSQSSKYTAEVLAKLKTEIAEAIDDFVVHCTIIFNLKADVKRYNPVGRQALLQYLKDIRKTDFRFFHHDNFFTGKSTGTDGLTFKTFRQPTTKVIKPKPDLQTCLSEINKVDFYNQMSSYLVEIFNSCGITLDEHSLQSPHKTRLDSLKSLKLAKNPEYASLIQRITGNERVAAALSTEITGLLEKLAECDQQLSTKSFLRTHIIYLLEQISRVRDPESVRDFLTICKETLAVCLETDLTLSPREQLELIQCTYTFLNYVSEQISLDYVRLYAFWLAGDLEHNLSSRFEGSFEDFGLHSPQGLYARYSDPSHRLSPSRSRNAMAGGIGAQALGPLPFSPFQMPGETVAQTLTFSELLSPRSDDGPSQSTKTIDGGSAISPFTTPRGNQESTPASGTKHGISGPLESMDPHTPYQISELSLNPQIRAAVKKRLPIEPDGGSSTTTRNFVAEFRASALAQRRPTGHPTNNSVTQEQKFPPSILLGASDVPISYVDGSAKNEKVQSDTKDRLPLPPSNVSSDSSNSSDSDEDSDHSSSGSSSNGDSRLRWLYEEGKRRSQSEERILRTKVKRGNGEPSKAEGRSKSAEIATIRDVRTQVERRHGDSNGSSKIAGHTPVKKGNGEPDQAEEREF